MRDRRCPDRDHRVATPAGARAIHGRARRQRVSFLQEHTGVGLDDIAATSLDPESLTRVTEAFIGTVEVPVGAAGPLLFHGQHAQGHLFAPMATTEGSLVASAIRGATAITASGGGDDGGSRPPDHARSAVPDGGSARCDVPGPMGAVAVRRHPPPDRS